VPGSAHPAAACTGTDANRDFFADASTKLGFTVYCPVLPGGWVVDAGSYRLANGGKLDIAYRNRSGARLELHEGAFCTTGGGCVPAGSDEGTASFGDLPGDLVAVGADSWALSVDADKPISWLAVGTNIDEATFTDATAALSRVGD
jgi:hypothetical protein